ncbi:hypothetical protein MG293_000377 [Ovis ammon polii]|uniref:NADP-dependent oxidoreductase domain-containing protein n=1 Tax=Ovis ammon polii TaxID=230172 RepID=A0AAD4UNP3_OVIAM|nr:hypothetical protein MG293_000377 [Ovis ammon polii]
MLDECCHISKMQMMAPKINEGLSLVPDTRQALFKVAERLMTIAYESGVNLFDTAEVYAAGKAEVILGSIIKKKGWRAETERGLSRKHIIEGEHCCFHFIFICGLPVQEKYQPRLKGSLQRLQLEYVDVVFANRPDSNTPMEEIVRAMTHVINQGMAMYWGTSRWSAMEIMEAYSVARQFNMIPPVCEQAEYHLFQREKVEVQLPELYHKIGVGAMTWSPLACGIISGKYGNGVPESSRASLKCYQWLKERIVSEEGRKQQNKLKDLSPIAERLGCTLPQLAVEQSHKVYTGPRPIPPSQMLMAFTYCYHPFTGEGNGTPLQYSCLENPMDGGAWLLLTFPPSTPYYSVTARVTMYQRKVKDCKLLEAMMNYNPQQKTMMIWVTRQMYS